MRRPSDAEVYPNNEVIVIENTPSPYCSFTVSSSGGELQRYVLNIYEYGDTTRIPIYTSDVTLSVSEYKKDREEQEMPFALSSGGVFYWDADLYSDSTATEFTDSFSGDGTETDFTLSRKNLESNVVTVMTTTEFTDTFSGDDSETEFTLSNIDLNTTEVVAVVDNIILVEDTDFTVNRTTGVVTFNTAPTTGTDNISISAEFDLILVEDIDFTVDRVNGIVTFNAAPSEDTNNIEVTAFAGVKDITTKGYKFYYYNDAVIDFTDEFPLTITEQSYLFNCDFSQAQGDSPEEFTFTLYYEDGTEFENSDREDGSKQESSNLSYEFNNLRNGFSYKVQCVGTTKDRLEFESEIASFNVSYTAPTVTFQNPLAEVLENTGINVKWGFIQHVFGVLVGTYSYLLNFYDVEGNYRVQIDDDSLIYFDFKGIQPTFFSPVVFITPEVLPEEETIFHKLEKTSTGEFVSASYKLNNFLLNKNGLVDVYPIQGGIKANTIYITAIWSDGIDQYLYINEIGSLTTNAILYSPISSGINRVRQYLQRG